MSFRRIILLVIGAMLLLLASCSSGDGDAAVPNSVNVPADSGEESDSPTATDEADESPAETAPEVLRAVDFSEVFISPNGNDNNDGSAPGQAKRTVASALGRLSPGGTITFTAGTYPPLQLVDLSGTPNAPIRLRTSGNVEFRDSDYRSGAGILIRNSRHISISGMQVRHSLWGVMIQNSRHIDVVGLDVRDIGQEGIRVKEGSAWVRLERNTVADTGRRTDQGLANGEGIYIGTGTPAGVDHVDNIRVLNNRVLRTTDEAIDIKRPATNVVVRGNEISDVVTHTSGAIVVHLNGDSSSNPNIVIDANIIRNVTRSSQYRDGNCIVAQSSVTITNNVLHNCQHRGIYLRGSQGTATVRHNTLLSTGDNGTVVNEGRGMRVVSQNNLGAPGTENRNISADMLRNPNNGNYELTAAAATDLDTAPAVGVARDLVGASRPANGPVTFGAVEASTGSASAAPTTTAPSQSQPATPPTTVQSNPVPTTSAAATPAPRPTPKPRPTPATGGSSANSTPTPNGSVPDSLGFVDTETGTNNEATEPAQVSCIAELSCDWAPFL